MGRIKLIILFSNYPTSFVHGSWLRVQLEERLDLLWDSSFLGNFERGPIEREYLVAFLVF